jgi:hypothetical protein
LEHRSFGALLVNDDLASAGGQQAINVLDPERMLEMGRFPLRARGHVHRPALSRAETMTTEWGINARCALSRRLAIAFSGNKRI